MRTPPYRPLRRTWLAFLACSVVLVSVFGACGAQNVEAPAPQPRPQQCQSLAQLAPAFAETLSGGQAERLRKVIEQNRLLETQSDGSPSPVITVLKVVVGTMNRFAADPPEPGAPINGVCNDEQPPLPGSANRMCEARRLIKTFVRDGKGLEALGLLDPFIAGILKYVTGQAPVATRPHYEVAGVINAACSKPVCRTEDFLDLVAGILDFISPTGEEPDRPRRVLQQINDLVNHPSMAAAFDTLTSSPDLGEDELVLFTDLLLNTIGAMPTDPDKFDQAFHKDLEIKVNDLLNQLKISRVKPTDPAATDYSELRLALDQLIGSHEGADATGPHGTGRPLLYDMLDPRRPAPILAPTQKVLNCIRKNDPDSAMVKAVFALGFHGDVIGLRDIVKAVNELTSLDERGTILNFAKVLLTAFRRNEEGLTATRKLCAVAFDARKPEGGGPSNVELMAPVLVNLFEDGAVGEILCVVDTLLYGCAGGARPACPTAVVPP